MSNRGPGLVSRLLNLLATARGTTRNHKHIYPIITKARYNAMDPMHKVLYRRSEEDGKYHLLPDNEWPHVKAARTRKLNANARNARLLKMSQPPPVYSPARSRMSKGSLRLPNSSIMTPTGSPLSPSTRRNTTAKNTRRLNTYDKDVQLKIVEYMNEKGKTVDETLRKLDSYSPELKDLILLSVGNGASLEEAFETAEYYS